MAESEEDTYKRIKSRLNKVSASFCLAKWKQVTLHLQNGTTHSCHHPPAHKVDGQEIINNPSALHNTKLKKETRRQMLEGQRPSECYYCWDIEDQKGAQVSDRYIKSSDESFINDSDVESISKTHWQDNIAPSYVEVSFSNTCNLKCAYCSPLHSSKWQQEINKEGSYPLFGKRELHSLSRLDKTNQSLVNHNDINPYVEAFWSWWPQLKQSIKVFRITGGEPLLDSNTFKVLDHLIENPIKDLELSINTNACVQEHILNNLIDKLKIIEKESSVSKVHIYTSVDGHGKQAEYARFGLNYKQWLSNIDLILTKLELVEVTVMCTTNILSVTSLDSLLKDIYSFKKKHSCANRPMALQIDFTILREPGHLDISLLPNTFAHTLNTSLHYIKQRNKERVENLNYGFCNLEVIKLKRVIDYLEQGSRPKDDYTQAVLKADFALFIKEYDRRRNLNFLKVFPELIDFHKECNVKLSILPKLLKLKGKDL